MGGQGSLVLLQLLEPLAISFARLLLPRRSGARSPSRRRELGRGHGDGLLALFLQPGADRCDLGLDARQVGGQRVGLVGMITAIAWRQTSISPRSPDG